MSIMLWIVTDSHQASITIVEIFILHTGCISIQPGWEGASCSRGPCQGTSWHEIKVKTQGDIVTLLTWTDLLLLEVKAPWLQPLLWV